MELVALVPGVEARLELLLAVFGLDLREVVVFLVSGLVILVVSVVIIYLSNLLTDFPTLSIFHAADPKCPQPFLLGASGVIFVTFGEPPVC